MKPIVDRFGNVEKYEFNQAEQKTLQKAVVIFEQVAFYSRNTPSKCRPYDVGAALECTKKLLTAIEPLDGEFPEGVDNSNA